MPFVVLEKYESSEGRSPGEATLSDIPAVLAQRNDMCSRMVHHCLLTILILVHSAPDVYLVW
jgi:hypothetical protein